MSNLLSPSFSLDLQINPILLVFSSLPIKWEEIEIKEKVEIFQKRFIFKQYI